MVEIIMVLEMKHEYVIRTEAMETSTGEVAVSGMGGKCNHVACID